MFRLVILVLAAFGAIALVRWVLSASSGRRDLKCADCIHCRKLFRDGALCGYGAREVFKNPAHIDMCVDYTREA